MHVGGVAFGFKAAPWVGWVARHACARPYVCRGSSQWAQLPMPQALGATLVGLLGCRRGQKVGLPTLLKLENLIVGHGGSVVVGPKGHDKKKCAHVGGELASCTHCFSSLKSWLNLHMLKPQRPSFDHELLIF